MEMVVRDAQNLYRLRQLECLMRGRPTLRHRRLMVWRRQHRAMIKFAWQLAGTVVAGLLIGGLLTWIWG